MVEGGRRERRAGRGGGGGGGRGGGAKYLYQAVSRFVLHHPVKPKFVIQSNIYASFSQSPNAPPGKLLCIIQTAWQAISAYQQSLAESATVHQTVDITMKKKKNCTSFCQPTRLITCANYGNHVQIFMKSSQPAPPTQRCKSISGAAAGPACRSQSDSNGGTIDLNNLLTDVPGQVDVSVDRHYSGLMCHCTRGASL